MCLKRSGDNSSPTSLPTEQTQVYSSPSNNISQNEEHETEMGTTANLRTQPLVNEGRLTKFEVLNLLNDLAFQNPSWFGTYSSMYLPSPRLL